MFTIKTAVFWRATNPEMADEIVSNLLRDDVNDFLATLDGNKVLDVRYTIGTYDVDSDRRRARIYFGATVIYLI
jgi:hypothetical protein